jgi:Methyltransferase domain
MWCSASRRTGFSGETLEIAREDAARARALPRKPQPCQCPRIAARRSKIQLSAHESAEDPALKEWLYLHKSDSAETLQSFPDAYFDWIYIDAQHTYEGVKRDIAAAAAKVNSDGFLVFNDYTMWSYVEMQPYGVVAAVNEFCIEHDWEFAYLTLPDHMYCDVAARKINRA